MDRVTLSPKYQVVIPESVRSSMQLQPGEQFDVIEHKGRVELIPVRAMRRMRGFLKGIDTTVTREKDRQ